MNFRFDRPVLVTGGAGFIGSHLIDHLLNCGNRVISVDNLNVYYNPEIKIFNQRGHENNNNHTFLQGDIRNSDFIHSLFKQYDIGIVIHLAAMAGVRPSLENPVLYTDVNINGTQVLLDTMSEYPIEKFIFASSSSVYGNNEKIPFSEDDNVDFQISPYGATKKMGEILCYTYYYLYKTPTTCLRFFTVYGPRQRPEMAIHKFVRRIFNGQSIPFYGDGNTARDYTYIDDIVSGILHAIIAKDDFIIYNLGNSEPIKLTELVDIICNLTGKKARLEKQDLPAGDVKLTYADINRARQRLDYKPITGITDGIQEFIDWYKIMKSSHTHLF